MSEQTTSMERAVGLAAKFYDARRMLIDLRGEVDYRATVGMFAGTLKTVMEHRGVSEVEAVRIILKDGPPADAWVTAWLLAAALEISEGKA